MNSISVKKSVFSGHDSFHCRQFWLKKGFDFVAKGNKFSDEHAVVHLGIGKNMVSAVRHWLRAFDILDANGEITDLAKKIFSENGWDPYLEDEATLWLLHYLIVSNEYASTFSYIFTQLQQERPEFDLRSYQNYLNRIGEEVNSNSLKKDFTVFYRTYFGQKDSKDLEDSFSGILTELSLLEEVEKSFVNENGKIQKFKKWLLQRKNREDLPLAIFYFSILNNEDYGKSISFDNLYNDKKGPGKIFLMTKEGLTNKLEELSSMNHDLIFSNEAGIRELQFKSKKPDPLKTLKSYYE